MTLPTTLLASTASTSAPGQPRTSCARYSGESVLLSVASARRQRSRTASTSSGVASRMRQSVIPGAALLLQGGADRRYLADVVSHVDVHVDGPVEPAIRAEEGVVGGQVEVGGRVSGLDDARGLGDELAEGAAYIGEGRFGALGQAAGLRRRSIEGLAARQGGDALQVAGVAKGQVVNDLRDRPLVRQGMGCSLFLVQVSDQLFEPLPLGAREAKHVGHALGCVLLYL